MLCRELNYMIEHEDCDINNGKKLIMSEVFNLDPDIRKCYAEKILESLSDRGQMAPSLFAHLPPTQLQKCYDHISMPSIMIKISNHDICDISGLSKMQWDICSHHKSHNMTELCQSYQTVKSLITVLKVMITSKLASK